MRECNCHTSKRTEVTGEPMAEKTVSEPAGASELLAEWFGPASAVEPTYKEIRRYRGKIDEWISLQSRKLQSI